ELALTLLERAEDVSDAALRLALQRRALERAVAACAADLRLPVLRQLRDRELGQLEVVAGDAPLRSDRSAQRRERGGDPVAVLVDVVAGDLACARPDVRIVVIAVLAGEEAVMVVVDARGEHSRGRRTDDGDRERPGAAGLVPRGALVGERGRAGRALWSGER